MHVCLYVCVHACRQNSSLPLFSQGCILPLRFEWVCWVSLLAKSRLERTPKANSAWQPQIWAGGTTRIERIK